MSAWLAGGVLFGVTLVFVATGGPGFGSTGVPARPATIDIPSPPMVRISEDGASLTGLSLTATVGLPCVSAQVNWTIYWSTVGPDGPWQEFGSPVLGPNQLIEGVSNLVPGATYWWNASVREPCVEGLYFNTLEFTQPDTATLDSTITSPTSVTLRWNNLATYGGLVAFGSYTIERSVNNGSWTPITKISNVSLTTGNVSGLSPGADYAFEINTTDVISGASGFIVSNKVLVSSSNVGSLNTTTTALTFADWVLIGLGVGLVALLTAIVLAVRREPQPPKGPAESRAFEGSPRSPPPPTD